MSRRLLTDLLMLAAVLGAAVTAAAQDDPGSPDGVEVGFEAPEAEEAAVVRTTLAPWSVDVLGRSYENFDNDDASIVLNDWLINALMEVPVFHVVNRDKIQAALSEQQLVSSGYAEDVSTTALADAGKLLKVNYILLGNFKNLGQTTEIDFKLLDVDTATYSVTLNFTVPFNPSLEAVKPDVDRVVAALAERFPIVSEITSIESPRRLELAAGAGSGVAEDMEVQIVARAEPEGVLAHGWVVATGEGGATVELDEEAPDLSLFDHVARVKVVPPAQAALNRAMRAFRAGDLEAAADSYAKGLEIDPRDGELQAGHARTYHRLGDYEIALPSFRKAIALRPDDEELLDDASRAFFEAGKFGQLIQMVGDEPRTPTMAVLLGRVRGLRGQLDLEEEAFRAALRLDPADAAGHLHQGLASLRRDAREEGLRELRLAAEMTRDDPVAGWAHRIAAEGALEPEPEGADFDALAIAAETLLATAPDRWQEALGLVRRSLERNGVFLPARLLEARILESGGSRAEAIAVLDTALREAPENYALTWHLARLLADEGRLADARQKLDRAAELAPEEWRPLELEGDLLASQGSHLEAAGAYQDALTRAEKAEADELVDILYGLGRSLTLASQHARALPHLERCVALAPAHESCHYFLGLGAFAVGDPASDEKALRAFQAAGSIDERHYYLAVLWERRGNIGEAAEAYRSCIEAECERSPEAQRRLDEIETISGKVIDKRGGDDAAKLTLSVGSVHGVKLGMRAVVVGGGGDSRIQVEQLDDATSVARLEKGTALVGQTVRFRPARPQGLAARPHEKKGVQLTWRRSREPEVSHYIVYRSEREGGSLGLELDRIKSRDAEYRDKKADPGRTYYYSVVAMSELDMKSLPSARAKIRLE